jgi:hypothetical protein
MGSADYLGWTERLLQNLDLFGPDASTAAAFIRQRKTRLSIHDQPTGARWTVSGRIEIHPRYTQLSPDNPTVISLIIHEVRHLQQGPVTALSVFGELDAWQLQFNFLRSITGRYHYDPPRDVVLQQLMQLPLNFDRAVLETARSVMQQYAGKSYRVDLLPLYPWIAEIKFRFTHRGPSPRKAPWH